METPGRNASGFQPLSWKQRQPCHAHIALHSIHSQKSRCGFRFHGQAQRPSRYIPAGPFDVKSSSLTKSHWPLERPFNLHYLVYIGNIYTGNLIKADLLVKMESDMYLQSPCLLYPVSGVICFTSPLIGRLASTLPASTSLNKCVQCLPLGSVPWSPTSMLES